MSSNCSSIHSIDTPTIVIMRGCIYMCMCRIFHDGVTGSIAAVNIDMLLMCIVIYVMNIYVRMLLVWCM